MDQQPKRQVLTLVTLALMLLFYLIHLLRMSLPKWLSI